MSEAFDAEAGGGGVAGEEVGTTITASQVSFLMRLWEKVSKFRSEKLQDMRPWNSFMSKKAFSVSLNPVLLKTRVTSNIPYFSTNYTIVVLAFMALTVLWSPMLIFILALPLGLFYYLLRLQEMDSPLPVVGISAGYKQRLAIVGVVSAGVLLYSLADLIFLVGSSSIFVFVHSLLAKTREEVEDENLFLDTQV